MESTRTDVLLFYSIQRRSKVVKYRKRGANDSNYSRFTWTDYWYERLQLSKPAEKKWCGPFKEARCGFPEVHAGLRKKLYLGLAACQARVDGIQTTKQPDYTAYIIVFSKLTGNTVVVRPKLWSMIRDVWCHHLSPCRTDIQRRVGRGFGTDNALQSFLKIGCRMLSGITWVL